MSNDRLTLALPIDVARAFDSTVTQAQINQSTFQNSPDDDDLIASFIEDAEDEFRLQTDVDMRVGRVGVQGKRETYETVEYKLSGHKQYRRKFSHATFDYSFREGTVHLDNQNILPFDPTQGDEAYIYWGLGGAGNGEAWEEITDDRGEIWDIINNRAGEVVIDPNTLLTHPVPRWAVARTRPTAQSSAGSVVSLRRTRRKPGTGRPSRPRHQHRRHPHRDGCGGRHQRLPERGRTRHEYRSHRA